MNWVQKYPPIIIICNSILDFNGQRSTIPLVKKYNIPAIVQINWTLCTRLLVIYSFYVKLDSEKNYQNKEEYNNEINLQLFVFSIS